MTDKYILDEHGSPVPEPDLHKWEKWLEKSDRHIARDEIGDVTVSTVFLGIDHSWGDGDPILFETMIFGGKHDQYQVRYSTRIEAIHGHADAVQMVRPWIASMRVE